MSESQSESSSVSLSFLDIIACAFGAVVLLILILPVGTFALEMLVSDSDTSEHGRMLLLSSALDDEIDTLRAQLAQNETLIQQMQSEETAVADANTLLQRTIDETLEESSKVQLQMNAVQATQAILARPTPAQDDPFELPTEVSGIPVDSEYVAFVIDTSGSMQSIWGSVVAEAENLLTLYPEIKGFQFISDNGAYLYRVHARRWMPDTSATRKIAISRLQTWGAASNSSPVEGIERAIRDLYRPDISMAVIVIGDDYSGISFDGFLNKIDGIVTSAGVGGGTLRIHAVGLWNDHMANSSLNFSVLMRELTRRYDGAFVGIRPAPTPFNTVDLLDLFF